jgi:Pentapeptide repeats (8 copies)
MASDTHLARLMKGAPAWNEWRRSDPLTRPELEGLALTLGQKQWGETNGGPIDLSRAVLNGADLRHATLNGANLGSASLNGADLSGARLIGADLRNADLSRAFLDEADLSDALLDGANLQGTDLSGVRHLTQSQLDGTKRDRRTRLPEQLDPRKAGHNVAAGAAAMPSMSDVASGSTQAGIGEAPPACATRATLDAVVRARAQTTAAVAAVNALGRPPAAGAADLPEPVESNPDPVVPETSWHRRVPEPVLLLAFSFGALVLLFGVERLLSLYTGNDTMPTEPPAIVVAKPSQPPVEIMQPPRETAAVPEKDPAAEQTRVVVDRDVRMTFALGADEPAREPVKPAAAPSVVSHEEQAVIGSEETDEAQGSRPHGAVETKQSSDLASPQLAARTPTPPPAMAQSEGQPQERPGTIGGALGAPEKSSNWIELFVRDVYLSGVRLEEPEIRRFYSKKVDYFGQRKVSLDKVAREKARYYSSWPKRHYDLVPGSISIDWQSDQVADVTFLYDFEVASPQKGATSGRGRARLTLDLGGVSGLIVREDGEVISSN